MKRWTLLALAALSVACAAGPEPIRWGTDTCEQCRMVLDDRRFGVEVVDGGRTYKFDGLDELVKYRHDHGAHGAVYVTDAATGALVPLETATLVASLQLVGPMGGHVVALASRDAAEAYVREQHLHGVRWLTAGQALETEGDQHARR